MTTQLMYPNVEDPSDYDPRTQSLYFLLLIGSRILRLIECEPKELLDLVIGPDLTEHFVPISITHAIHQQLDCLGQRILPILSCRHVTCLL